MTGFPPPAMVAMTGSCCQASDGTCQPCLQPVSSAMQVVDFDGTWHEQEAVEHAWGLPVECDLTPTSLPVVHSTPLGTQLPMSFGFPQFQHNFAEEAAIPVCLEYELQCMKSMQEDVNSAQHSLPVRRQPPQVPVLDKSSWIPLGEPAQGDINVSKKRAIPPGRSRKGSLAARAQKAEPEDAAYRAAYWANVKAELCSGRSGPLAQLQKLRKTLSVNANHNLSSAARSLNLEPVHIDQWKGGGGFADPFVRAKPSELWCHSRLSSGHFGDDASSEPFPEPAPQTPSSRSTEYVISARSSSSSSAAQATPIQQASLIPPWRRGSAAAFSSTSCTRDDTRRQKQVAHSVLGQLNKICPSNLNVIVDNLASIDLQTHDELETVIRILLTKALREPHYSETYADMVYALRMRYPEFPPESQDGKPVSFTRVLLGICQAEFESLPAKLGLTKEEMGTLPRDELEEEFKSRKASLLATMRFVGNLFLRQLLSTKVIGRIIHDLMELQEAESHGVDQHLVEAACELLRAAGHTLDSTPQGGLLISRFFERIEEVYGGGDDSTYPALQKRIVFKIQDLQELRKNAWIAKTFHEKAKPREHLRQENRTAKSTWQTVGERPKCVASVSSAKSGETAEKDSDALAIQDSAEQVQHCDGRSNGSHH